MNSKDLLKPVNMINLYSQGAFPMADDNGEISWYQPKERCIIMMENFNIPKSLRRFMSSINFEYRVDENTIEVIRNCADRETTWISEELIIAYKDLAKLGYLHSVEVYQNNILVGGLYGIAIGGVFFGESMFSKVSQASKTALATLLVHLQNKDFIFLDVQFPTPHLKMFGTIEIDFEEYNDLLEIAYRKEINF